MKKANPITVSVNLKVENQLDLEISSTSYLQKTHIFSETDEIIDVCRELLDISYLKTNNDQNSSRRIRSRCGQFRPGVGVWRADIYPLSATGAEA